MKKRNKIILYITLVIVLLAVFIFPRLNSSNKDKGPVPANRQTRNAVVNVKGHIAATEDISNNISSIGTALASEEVDIRSETTGRVTSIAFKEGSIVGKGQLLVKINDSELQAQLAKAKTRLKLLEDRETRQRVLFEKQYVSREDYDVALNELNVLKSDIDLLNVQIAKTEIRAPFSGKIGIRNISEGAYVTPTTAIATLQNISQIKIDFSVPEKYAALLKPGDHLSFKSASDKEFRQAKVYAIEPKINASTRTIQVRGIYANTANKVVPGSFVDVQLELEKITDAVLIPSFALIPDIKSDMVYLFRNGKALQQPVETSLRTANNVQVIRGIKPGDTVITSGILQLKSGMKVNITSFE